jgi:hypothetical protein
LQWAMMAASSSAWPGGSRGRCQLQLPMSRC